MISYSEDPLPLGDQGRLKGWFDTELAQTFKACAVAQMNQHYFNAINEQEQCESVGDKFDERAKYHLDQAKRIHTFLAVLNEFASKEYAFHKLKINT